tara:strand:+ start:60 stop:590 length:531 start_codon:yes stop_codon:yes gene_type:complete
MKEKLEILHKPLTADEIEWKIQSKTKTGKTVIVPYISNRAVQSRFDEAFGALGWKNEFSVWHDRYQKKGRGDETVVVERGIKACICVYCDEKREWVCKYDGANESAIEPTKGGFSDSMKRVSTQWGMGRNLYEYPTVMIDGLVSYIPNKASKQLIALTQKINRVGVTKDFIILKNE